MGKKSPTPPPAPDYAAAAQQQGQANLEAARLTARLSNPNIRTPLGGQRVTFGRPQFNEAAYNAAMANWRARNPQAPATGTPTTGAPPTGAPPTTNIGGGAAMPTGGQDLKAVGGPVMRDTGMGFEDREYAMGGPAQQRAAQMGGASGGGSLADLLGSNAPTTPYSNEVNRFGLSEQDFTRQLINQPFQDTGMMGRAPTISPAMGADMGLGGGRIDASGMGPGQMTRAAQGFPDGVNQYGYTGDAMPTREMFTTMTDLDTPYIEQYLTPEAQATLEAQQRVERALAGLGEQAIGQVSNIYGTPFQAQGLPQQQFTLQRGQLPTLPQMQGQARSDVSALPVNYGPAVGQYGMATGGPAAGQFGAAIGGPAGLALGGLDTSGLTGVQTGVGQFGTAQGGPAAPTLQGQLDTSRLAAMPVQAGMTAQEAIMSRLEPQLQRQRTQLETQLVNQGLARGGEAYNAAVTEQAQRENDLRTQAALQGIQLDMAARQQGLSEAQALGGFANQAALAGFGAGQQATAAQNAAIAQNAQLALQSGQFANQAQAQQFAQRLAAGEFGREAQLASFQTGQAAQDAVNRAIAQNFAQAQAAAQMGNQAIAQNFAQGLQAQGAYNAAAAQQFGQEMDIAGLYNAALSQNQQAALQQAQAQAALQAQGFNQEQAAAAFQNAQRQAALQEQLAMRQLPLNEIAAIMSGAQIQLPQFQGYQGAEVGAAPIFGAAQAAGNFAQQNYANQVSAQNAKMGLYGSLAGMAGTALGGSLGGAIGAKMFATPGGP